MTVDEASAPVVRVVHVRRQPADCFRIFTDEIGAWWPLLTHSVYGDKAVGVEFVDGKIVETSAAGERCEWGTVTGWEPPDRLAFTWHPGHGAERATALEIEFRPDGDGTRLVLTHHGWEVLGERAQEARASYFRGWVPVLEAFLRQATA